MANPLKAPSLEPSSVDPMALQAAVDQFEPVKIKGLEPFRGAGYDVAVIGVDIMPGIVVRQPDDSLTAAAKIYLELKRRGDCSTDTIRASVEFRVEGTAVVIDEIVAASRAA